MVFSSLEFIFIFLPVFLITYAAVPSKYKNLIILLGSVIFYSLGVKKPVYIVLFLLTNMLNFIVGQFIEDSPKFKKTWLAFGVAFNFWWLIFFKYWTFGTENINILFGADLPLKDKITAVAKRVYRAKSVVFGKGVLPDLKKLESEGCGAMPVCIAKTQYSFSDNPKLLGAPEGVELTIRSVRLSRGAGFVVAFAGDIIAMPGLPPKPAADSIGVDESGGIYGLF